MIIGRSIVSSGHGSIVVNPQSGYSHHSSLVDVHPWEPESNNSQVESSGSTVLGEKSNQPKLSGRAKSSVNTSHVNIIGLHLPPFSCLLSTVLSLSILTLSVTSAAHLSTSILLQKKSVHGFCLVQPYL